MNKNDEFSNLVDKDIFKVDEYKKYVEKMGPKSIPVLSIAHEHLSQNKDYNQIDKDIESLYNDNDVGIKYRYGYRKAGHDFFATKLQRGFWLFVLRANMIADYSRL